MVWSLMRALPGRRPILVHYVDLLSPLSSIPIGTRWEVVGECNAFVSHLQGPKPAGSWCDMKERARAFTPAIAGREVVMEGQDMRAVVLTLAAGQSIPWHYHSDITDSFVCLEGPMVVET